MKGEILLGRPSQTGRFNVRCAVPRYTGPKTPKHGAGFGSAHDPFRKIGFRGHAL